MHILPKAGLRRLTDALKERYALYGPVRHEVSGEVIFDFVADPGEIDLEAPIPYNPPKGVVFPQAERIMSFFYDRANKAVSIEPAGLVAPKALVGLRSCDLNGLLCLDRFDHVIV